VLAILERDLEGILSQVEKDKEEIAKAAISIAERSLREIEEEAQKIVLEIESRLERDLKHLEKYREEEKNRIIREIDETAEKKYQEAIRESIKILRNLILEENIASR
jgi:F0F1-type ATP synthase membrane subunit b/b'